MIKQVMVVDDSSTVRKVLQVTLVQAGYDVIEAIDGEEALKQLTENSIDMLITDLNMPNLDGIGLIKQVRQKSGYRFMPIIMLTTESQPEQKLKGKAAGASGWITKPFKPEQLLSIVRTVCPAT